MVDSDTKYETDAIRNMVLRLLAIDQIGASIIIKNECNGVSPFLCIETIIVPALKIIGQRWEEGDVSLSQVYLSGKICESIVESIIDEGWPLPEQKSKVAMAVLEDHHNLGKRIVISILKAGGFSVIDYGHGLTVNELAKKALDDELDILLVSTLMLNAALKTKELISIIRKERPHMRIIVGGAPYHFDSQLFTEVGADAYSQSASESLHIVEKMVQGVF